MARVMAAQATRSPRYFGKIDRCADAADVMAGASDALHAARHRGRRFDLHDQVDRAHIDAEFERRVATRPRRVPRLQAFFDLFALRDGDAAVVRPNQVSPARSFNAPEMRSARRRLLTKIRVDRCARTSSTAWDESRSRWRVERGPATPGRWECGTISSSAPCLERNFDSQIQPLRLAGIHDRDRAVPERVAVGLQLIHAVPWSRPHWRP